MCNDGLSSYVFSLSRYLIAALILSSAFILSDILSRLDCISYWIYDRSASTIDLRDNGHYLHALAACTLG